MDQKDREKLRKQEARSALRTEREREKREERIAREKAAREEREIKMDLGR